MAETGNVRPTLPLPDLIRQGTPESLAKAYMGLVGRNVLKLLDKSTILWFDGSEWLPISTCSKIIKTEWEPFCDSVCRVLRDGAEKYKIDLGRTAARLYKPVFIRQIFEECKTMIVRVPMTRKIEQEHLNEQVRRFLRERCELGKTYRQSSEELFAGYIAFCRRNGEIERYYNSFNFSRHLGLQSDLFTVQDTPAERVVIGLRLKR